MSGGYAKYLENVIPRIATDRRIESVLCAVPQSIYHTMRLSAQPCVRYVPCRPYTPFYFSSDTGLNEHLRRFSPNVLFVPGERYYRYQQIPVVCMIQNMEPFSKRIHANPKGEALRNWLRRIDGVRSLRKAGRVIAISHFVRDFLTQECGIETERIGLVYHGVDHADNEAETGLRITVGDGGFLFSCGSIRPARGVEDLLAATRYLAGNEGDGASIIFAGSADKRMARYIDKLISETQGTARSGNVAWVGSLSQGEMAWCYRNCEAFVMTSRVEACPNTALEAMSNGCICIAANNPPLPEIFGDAALYYPPGDAAALAEQIQRVRSLRARDRASLGMKARAEAERFSWEVCAERTVDELEKAQRG